MNHVSAVQCLCNPSSIQSLWFDQWQTLSGGRIGLATTCIFAHVFVLLIDLIWWHSDENSFGISMEEFWCDVPIQTTIATHNVSVLFFFCLHHVRFQLILCFSICVQSKPSDAFSDNNFDRIRFGVKRIENLLLFLCVFFHFYGVAA